MEIRRWILLYTCVLEKELQGGKLKMNIKNKSILVTGGAGFIGSHLVDRLIKEEPEEIVVVDNLFLGKEANLLDALKNFENLKIFREDASNFEKMNEILRTENVKVVFDLAVIPLPTSLVKPEWTVDMNIKITNIFCELLREEAFETLIHCSSSEAYGSAEYVPMDEKHPLNPTTPYAASKAACDHIVLSYYRTFGLDAAIICPFNNFGPRQNERAYAGVIPTTIRRILEGLAPTIFGDGEQTRDYIYVADTADAIVGIYKNKNTRGKVVNIGSGKEISINNLIKTICQVMGYSNPPLYKDLRIGDVRRHCADITLAKELIDFKPKIDFEEGLKKTIEWYVKSLGGGDE
jgi:UDP-glucose 4-epimerase